MGAGVNDLTILYYTANRLPDAAALRIRQHLRGVAGKTPIVSVSQRPIAFGLNVSVGDIGANKYNAYWQILEGVQYVETEYVATVDDDTLYVPDHFEHRPLAGEFWYETNYWFCQDGIDHFWRPADLPTKGGGMWGCIAHTQTMRNNLEARFSQFPNPAAPLPPWWGEPGVSEGDRLYGRRDGLRRVASARPCLVFIHEAAMGYQQFSRWHRRYGQPAPENVTTALPDYGTVGDVRREFWGEAVAVNG